MELKTYKELGEYLSRLNSELVDEIVTTSKIKGKTNIHTEHLRKCIKNLSNLRSELEECLFIEYPKEANTKIFYPGD